MRLTIIIVCIFAAFSMLTFGYARYSSPGDQQSEDNGSNPFRGPQYRVRDANLSYSDDSYANSIKYMRQQSIRCMEENNLSACNMVYSNLITSVQGISEGNNNPDLAQYVESLRKMNENICQKNIPGSCAALAKYYGVMENDFGGKPGIFHRYIPQACVASYPEGCQIIGEIYLRRGIISKSKADVHHGIHWLTRGCQYFLESSCKQAANKGKELFPERKAQYLKSRTLECEYGDPFSSELEGPESCMESSKIYEEGQGVTHDIRKAAMLMRYGCDRSTSKPDKKSLPCQQLDELVSRRGSAATGISSGELKRIHACRNLDLGACQSLARQYNKDSSTILPVPLHIRYYSAVRSIIDKNSEAENALKSYCEKLAQYPLAEIRYVSKPIESCIRGVIPSYRYYKPPPLVRTPHIPSRPDAKDK